jgi:hypothetical protein
MDDLEAFRALVLEDADLQNQLLGVEDPNAFAALVSQLANERGIELTPGDVQWALDAARRTWSERVVV